MLLFLSLFSPICDPNRDARLNLCCGSKKKRKKDAPTIENIETSCVERPKTRYCKSRPHLFWFLLRVLAGSTSPCVSAVVSYGHTTVRTSVTSSPISSFIIYCWYSLYLTTNFFEYSNHTVLSFIVSISII